MLALVAALALSQGLYRLPFPDGTVVQVNADTASHVPPGKLDLGAGTSAKVVAAADGRVVAMADGNDRRQRSGQGIVCRNNYVWLAHPNGEWTKYTHMKRGSVTAAGLHVGDAVTVGQRLGIIGDVGCATATHLHFEVAVPPAGATVSADGGFLDGAGNREPRLCGVRSGVAARRARYVARGCPPDGPVL